MSSIRWNDPSEKALEGAVLECRAPVPRRTRNVFRAGCDSPPAVGRLQVPHSTRLSGVNGDKPASASGTRWKVSRSGQMPEPTVIVRMKEDGGER
jgi:hypothetical protein